MAIPLLEYSPVSQNHRVTNYEVSGDEHSRIYSSSTLLSSAKADELIWAAYRQIFNEQQIIDHNRIKALESHLKNAQISVRDFIRGLVLSDSFRRNNYEPNNNYRFVQMCIQRILGREVYHEREKLAWSTVLATKGLQGFVDDLLNSEEYLENFGYDTVPYQRRRILPQRLQGDLPFARMPRYGEDHRQQLEKMGYFKPFRDRLATRWDWQKPPYPAQVRLAGKVIVIAGAGLLTLGAIATALAAWGIISL
jgi:phycobilisome rod-core linker protein